MILPAYISDRDKQLMQHLANGHTARDIAFAMSMSNRTVEAYLAQLRDRLECRNTVQLVAVAMRNGWIR
jgi:DNA-binding NarL/FixJ family response regulator